jgi:2-polyprenyl-6-methoxyphenol hydroxylase-like FAD-dependent oxidoreductase
MQGSIAITGGGIAGLTTAIALQQIGLQPVIFEAAPVIREIGAGIGLGANAFKALHYLGIDKEIIEAGRDLSTFIIYNEKGSILSKTVPGKHQHGPENFAIHRAVLHNILLSHVDPQSIRTNKRLVDVVQGGGKLQLSFSDGSTEQVDHLVAADGIHSIVRKKLLPGSSVNYAGYTCWRAIIDNATLQWQQSSETWGRKGRFGIVPLHFNKMYWYACLNTPPDNEQMKRYTVQDLKRHFGHFHPPVAAILDLTKNEDLIQGDIIDLNPVNRFAFDNIVLTGDAAHATTPNLGQGACQAMEDAVILAQEIKKSNDFSQAIRHFEQRRLKRTHMIARQSRIIGSIAQAKNPLVIGIRNALLRLTPESFKEKEMKKIFEVDF